jgi:DNA repair exonuclease SbcCD ATPase subunit
MASKTSPRRDTSSERLAILETKMAALQTLSSSSMSSVDARLSSIESRIKEIHDKIDQHMLHQAVELTRLQSDHKNQKEQLSKLESKIYKVASIAGMLVASLITGAFNYFKS